MTSRITTRPTRRQAALTLTALAAFSFTACSSSSDDDAEFDNAQDTSSTDVADSDSGGEDSGTSDQEAGGSELVDPDDAVSTVTYTLPTDKVDGTMTVGLHHLRIRDNTVELLLTYTPDFDSDDTHTLLVLHGGNNTNVAPALFDRAHLKRYDILRDGRGWDSKTVWNSEHDQQALASGDTQAYWANFSVPEDDVESLDVAVPGAPEFEDVPLEQGSDAADDGQE